MVFLVSGDVKTLVHLIREDSRSRYMPTSGLTDHCPVMGTAHDPCTVELNPVVVSALSSTSPPLVPYFMRASLLR